MYKILLSAILLGSFLAAQSSYDYAYGFELEVEEGSALSRVVIPDEVYLHSLSPSLEDVAIFNKNDQVVAFSFVDTEKREDITHEIPVTLYFIGSKFGNRTNTYTYTYFIELSDKTDERPSLSKFKLGWESADYNWEARADVDLEFTDGYSDTSAARDALLADLKDVSDKSSLKSDEIALDYYTYYGDEIRGWQLVITSETQIPNITSVKAYKKEQFVDEPLVKLHSKPQKNADKSIAYEFPSAQPVEAISIDLGQSNLILPVSIFYKSGDRWIKLDGRVINEEAYIKLPQTVVAKEFLLKTNGDFDAMPYFAVHRKKTDIIFNSANNAPFILAYGSFGAKALDLGESAFLKGTKTEYIPTAYVGDAVKLNNKALEAAAETKGGVPKWVIWAALVLGVIFLIFLAYKLSKELKENQA
ncbi:MAG: DUF3999 domain-containing protein [Campylobacteraceae bacterium]|jgi:hypothetical protein|nr:DUF3999 domain-containing protein [Campylobacteraceae bacterium]